MQNSVPRESDTGVFKAHFNFKDVQLHQRSFMLSCLHPTCLFLNSKLKEVFVVANPRLGLYLWHKKELPGRPHMLFL